MVVPNDDARRDGIRGRTRDADAARHVGGGLVVTVHVEQLVRQRIARGHMPDTYERLIEVRGSIERAATDLAMFTGHTVGECLTALRTVYREDV